MNFTIKYQENYSRGELLLRFFFGFFYIQIPHFFVLYFLSIGLVFVNLFRFFSILFTGKWPKGMFDFAIKVHRYQARIIASQLDLMDGYPAFGLNVSDYSTSFNVEYQNTYSRSTLLLRSFFGGLLVFPHIFVLLFRFILILPIRIIAFFAVLFTGRYPKGMFDFVVGTLRINFRILSYLYYFTSNYPSFSGHPQDGETEVIETTSNSDILD